MLNQDDVLKMATEAGLCYESNGFIDWIDAGPSLHEMTLFAKLVADVATAKEREACAKVCEELAELSRISDTDSMWEWGECAAAIRARSNV